MWNLVNLNADGDWHCTYIFEKMHVFGREFLRREVPEKLIEQNLRLQLASSTIQFTHPTAEIAHR